MISAKDAHRKSYEIEMSLPGNFAKDIPILLSIIEKQINNAIYLGKYKIEIHLSSIKSFIKSDEMFLEIFRNILDSYGYWTEVRKEILTINWRKAT
jgi:hypothetical protein